MKNKYFTKIEKWQKVFAQILLSRLLHDPSLMKFKNFYGELLFIGMLFFPCSIQYDVVHPGPCLEYGNRFCEEKVANSFCLKKKNKCYCKPQFVNIKESYGVTCKPLLTNLKCNMDKNCRDVDGSTCHPGAGACTCPYNTLYVPQLHACKKQILSPENDAILCIKCKEIGGECFQYTNQIGNIHSYPVSNAGNNFPHIGCSCPGITTIQSDKVDDLSDAICNQILVDIGHPCNNMDLICRSSKAVCFETSLFSYSICHCPPGHVAVYQEYLGYHECYPSIKLNVDSCRLCLRTNGLCFDMNADEQPDGCYCGRLKTVQEDFKANGAHNDQNSLLQTCSKNIVEIFCWPENLKICYYPPKAPNHARFIDNITKQRALIFITDGHSLFREDDSGPNNECLLTIEETHRSRDNSIRFCIEKQLNTLEVNLPCGISATKYSNGYLYSGYVAVWVDKYFADPISDQLIDFSCKCDYSFLRMTPGQAIDRSWPVENINLNYNRESNTTTEFFNFSILNPDNSVVYSVFKMAPIKLYAVLNTEEIEYNSIAAESCWCTNSSDDSSPNNKWKLINRGCIESRSGFTTPFLLSSNSASTNQSNPDRKAFVELSSGFFPAFTMFDSSQLIFKCLFRFCKHKHWCSLRKQCTDDHPQFFTTPPPKRFDDIRFLVKSFKVSVVSVPKVDSVSRGGVKSVCSFFWCLPGDKLLLVISLLTVILLLVTALAFVLFRRHNQLINYRSNVFKETNTNNSLLKPSNNHLIHGYCPIPDDIWKSQNYAMCSCIDDCPPVSSSLCKDHINTDLCFMLNSNTLISTKSSNKRSEYEVAHSRKLNHDLDNAENQTINQNVSHFHVNDDNASSVGKDVESTEL